MHPLSNAACVHDQTAPDPLDLEPLRQWTTRIRFVRPASISLEMAARVPQEQWPGPITLLEVDSRSDLDQLFHLLEVVPGDSGYCMCGGDPHLQFLDRDGRLLAYLGLHHGESLRWDDRWSSDAQLVRGRELLVWISGRGLSEPLEQYEQALAAALEAENSALKWQAAMPSCLAPFWPDMAAIPFRTPDYPELLRQLVGWAGGQDDAIGYLIRWFGQGEGPWSGYPSYEDAARELLLQFPIEQLVRVVVHNVDRMTPHHLEGVARLFAGATARRHPGAVAMLPAHVRQILLTHCRENPLDADRMARAQNAFG